MPDLVKSLADVKECRSTELFVFQSCIDCVSNAMTLLNCRMCFSKAKLVMRYPVIEVCVDGDLPGNQLFHYFGNGRKQAYGAV